MKYDLFANDPCDNTLYSKIMGSNVENNFFFWSDRGNQKPQRQNLYISYICCNRVNSDTVTVKHFKLIS